MAIRMAVNVQRDLAVKTRALRHLGDRWATTPR